MSARVFRSRARSAVLSSAERMGLTIARFPESVPAWRRIQILHWSGVDTVLDVGANTGAYAQELRRFGYRGWIVSFEPVSGIFEALAERASSDPRWIVRNEALGAEPGEAEINVAGNAAASSSILPMCDRHVQAAPHAQYVKREVVTVSTLDHVSEWLPQPRRVFLKIDVQGYEGEVLRGGKRLIPTLMGLQVEVSLTPLYEGGFSLRDGVEFANASGFTVVSIEPGFVDPASKELLQADLVMLRPGAASRPKSIG